MTTEATAAREPERIPQVTPAPAQRSPHTHTHAHTSPPPDPPPSASWWSKHGWTALVLPLFITLAGGWFTNIQAEDNAKEQATVAIKLQLALYDLRIKTLEAKEAELQAEIKKLKQDGKSDSGEVMRELKKVSSTVSNISATQLVQGERIKTMERDMKDVRKKLERLGR